MAAGALLMSCGGARSDRSASHGGQAKQSAAKPGVRAGRRPPRYMYKITSPALHGHALVVGTARPLAPSDEARLLRRFRHARIARVAAPRTPRGKTTGR